MPAQDRAFLAWSLVVLSLLLYGALFFLPTFMTNNGDDARQTEPEKVRNQGGAAPPSADGKNEVSPGWYAFLVSGFAMFILWPFWLANPAFWFGLVFSAVRLWKVVTGLALTALLLGLSTIVVYDPSAPPPSQTCTSLTGLSDVKLTRLSTGYYCWVASFACLATGGLLVIGLNNSDSNQTEEEETRVGGKSRKPKEGRQRMAPARSERDGADEPVKAKPRGNKPRTTDVT